MIRPCLTSMLACTGPIAFHQSGADFETMRRSDVYAIYSLMMTSPKTSHADNNNSVYLIADIRIPGYPRQPCVQVSPEYQQEFDDVLADYTAREDMGDDERSSFLNDDGREVA